MITTRAQEGGSKEHSAKQKFPRKKGGDGTHSKQKFHFFFLQWILNFLHIGGGRWGRGGKGGKGGKGMGQARSVIHSEK